jgi:O-antigen/teichoic acid export membrane protein
VNAPGIRRALVGVVWLSAAGYLTFALNFGLNLLLARLLFPKDFGQFALAGSLAELLSLITGLSFSQGIIQIQDTPGVVETAYVLSLRLYLGLLLGGALVSAAFIHHYPGRFIPLFYSLFAVRNLSVISYVYSAQLERSFQYSQLSAVRLLASLVSIVVALGMAWRGAGVWSLLGREVALSVITLAGVRIASGWRYRGGYSAAAARRLWQFGRQMLAMRALEVVWYRADTAILGVIAGTLTLGFYDRGRYLAEFGHYMVAFAAVQVAFPVYSRLQARRGALTYAYRLSHGLLIRLMLPYLLWLALFPKELVGLLYGAGVRWNETAVILPWLAIFGFLFPVVDNIKVMLTGIGRLGDAVWIRLAQVIVSLPLLAPAIVIGGPRGAAIVMVLSEVGGLVAGYRALRLQVGGLYLRSYLRPAVAAAIAGGLVVAGRSLHLLPWVGRAGYAANLAAAALLYLVCLLIIDRQQIQEHLGALVDGFRGQAPAGWTHEPALDAASEAASAPAAAASVDGHRDAPIAPVLPEDPP